MLLFHDVQRELIKNIEYYYVLKNNGYWQNSNILSTILHLTYDNFQIMFNDELHFLYSYILTDVTRMVYIKNILKTTDTRISAAHIIHNIW